MRTFYLYEKFKNWEEKYDRIWLYSDFHGIGLGKDLDALMNKRLFNYADDEVKIAQINKVVNKQDLLVFLGDMGDYYNLSQLKCKNWILITGNHDKSSNFYKKDFTEVYDGPIFINDRLLLSHEPIHEIPGVFNIHGHLHNFSEIDNNNFHENYICISANLIDYRPICLSDLFKRKGEFKDFQGYSNTESRHRITIDKATEKKKNREKETL